MSNSEHDSHEEEAEFKLDKDVAYRLGKTSKKKAALFLRLKLDAKKLAFCELKQMTLDWTNKNQEITATFCLRFFSQNFVIGRNSCF